MIFSQRVVKSLRSIKWGEPIDFDALINIEVLKNEAGLFSVFPNPANKHLTIINKFPSFRFDEVQVFNAAGQQVESWFMKNRNEFTKSVAHLPKGAYWLVATNPDLQNRQVISFVIAP